MHNNKVQFIQQQHPLDNLNRSRTIKCYTINILTKHSQIVYQNVKQNQIRTCKSLYLHNTTPPTVILIRYWYQRRYLQILLLLLLLGIALMCSIITPTVMYRYNYHVLALQPHHYYWWSYSKIDTIRHRHRVSMSVSLYRRYVHHQQQRLQNYLYNQWQFFHTKSPSIIPVGSVTNSFVRPQSTRKVTTAARHYSTTDDTSNPSDDNDDTISTVSLIDWNQLVYDAYIEMETDGIQQLGKNKLVVNNRKNSKNDKNSNIGNSVTSGDHIDNTNQKNPIQHLSPNELWKITQQTAQQIALSKKNNNNNNNNNNKVIRKQSIDKINSNSDENANVPWTGIAASMLNGWIAACGSCSTCSINHDVMNISSINDYCKQQAMYAEELFHIATTGQNNVSKQMSSKKKLTITNNITLIVPDLVTYSLLYNIMIPINIELANYYLNLAQQQSKKIAGTQRRKLVTKLSTSRPIQKTESKSMMFRDYEMDLQKFLYPEMKNDITSDDIYPDSNSIPYNLILYENDDYMVINKPSGVCCYHTHVTTAGRRNIDLSIVDVLQKVRTGGPITLSTLNPSAFGIVHRLDRGTSGCLIIAKNDATHATIVSRLFQRQIQKTYTVLVSPAPCMDLYNTTGYITIPVHGKTAKSKYTIIERFVRNNTSIRTSKNGTNSTITKVETAALMNITTYTGRQHQVRVHCSIGLGTPIIGDTVYTTSATTKKINAIKGKNDRPIDTNTKREQFHLHASSISLFDPTNTTQNCNDNNSNNTLLVFDAPIPNWWLPVLDEWRV